MRHEYKATFEGLEIRPLLMGDIELLREWRNDIEQTQFLRNVGYITSEMQKKWYEAYVKNEEDLIFTIVETETLNRVVGSLSLYEWDRNACTCEIGKIQIGDKAAHGKGIGRKALVMAMKVAFQELGIKKILASVHPNNIQAYKNDMKVGFIVTGEIPSVAGGNEITLEIDEEQASRVNSYYESILVTDGGAEGC